VVLFVFLSSRRRHTRFSRDWSSDVCSSDLFGITFVHNGNLTNWRELRESLFKHDRRHINTNSDSEVLLNVFAHELQQASNGVTLDANAVFQAVRAVHRRAKGAYAVIANISSFGLV